MGSVVFNGVEVNKTAKLELIVCRRGEGRRKAGRAAKFYESCGNLLLAHLTLSLKYK